jgi:hypothetical protein
VDSGVEVEVDFGAEVRFEVAFEVEDGVWSWPLTVCCQLSARF